MPDTPPRLYIVSIMEAADSVEVDESGTLPASYSLLLGLSRRLTGYEIAELLDSTVMSFFNSGDLMWLGISDTTVDELAERRSEIQKVLDDVVSRASVLQQAIETTDKAHADAQMVEYDRRRALMSKINKSLKLEWETPPNQGSTS
jgi:hypothetical protein